MGIQAERLPRSRDANQLVLQELGDELLVYDRQQHRAHSLNRCAAEVFRRCDGHTSVADLRGALATAGLDNGDEAIAMALAQLRTAGLLDERAAPRSRSANAGGAAALRRRDALRKVGFIAGAAMALPLVQSIVAPSVAQAASCGALSTPCCGGTNCDPGLVCLGGTCQPDT